MTGLFDAFWRAAAYCLHPRVILLSAAPVLLAGGLVLGTGWLYWDSAVDAVQTALSYWTLADAALQWLDNAGFGSVRALIAPLVIVIVAAPLVVLLSLLLVAILMTPSIVALVAKRRFPALEARRGANGWQTTAWSLWITLVALLAMAITLPLWLLPLFGLMLPPLIWGWASGRIFAFEVLAEHASAEERRTLLHTHRGPLLMMGVIAGFMGAVPALVWTAGVLALVLAPLLLIVSVWLYTLVFAFAAAWFAHYALAALQQLRAQREDVSPSGPPPVLPVSPDMPLNPSPPALTGPAP